MAVGCWFSSSRVKGRSHIFCQTLNKTRKYTVYRGEALRPDQFFPSQISHGISSYFSLSLIGYHKRLEYSELESIFLVCKQIVKFNLKIRYVFRSKVWSLYKNLFLDFILLVEFVDFKTLLWLDFCLYFLKVNFSIVSIAVIMFSFN